MLIYPTPVLISLLSFVLFVFVGVVVVVVVVEGIFSEIVVDWSICRSSSVVVEKNRICSSGVFVVENNRICRSSSAVVDSQVLSLRILGMWTGRT